MTGKALFDYDAMNLSEITEIALQMNVNAHRGLPMEALIALIEGDEVELPRKTLDKKRLKIMQYINDHWAGVSYQVSCPAKSRDPHACFGCSDLQVTSCTMDNPKLFLADD